MVSEYKNYIILSARKQLTECVLTIPVRSFQIDQHGYKAEQCHGQEDSQRDYNDQCLSCLLFARLFHLLPRPLPVFRIYVP